MEETTEKEAPTVDRGMVDINELPAGTLLVTVSVDLKIEIRDYLSKSRPPQEVETLLNDVFSDDRINTVWTLEGYRNILSYLSDCTYREVSLIISKLVSEEHVKVYSIKPTEEVQNT